MIEQPETVRSSKTSWIASLALLGLAATTAWVAYRRLQGRDGLSVGDLIDAADKAAQALEERVGSIAAA